MEVVILEIYDPRNTRIYKDIRELPSRDHCLVCTLSTFGSTSAAKCFFNFACRWIPFNGWRQRYCSFISWSDPAVAVPFRFSSAARFILFFAVRVRYYKVIQPPTVLHSEDLLSLFHFAQISSRIGSERAGFGVRSRISDSLRCPFCSGKAVWKIREGNVTVSCSKLETWTFFKFNLLVYRSKNH